MTPPLFDGHLVRHGTDDWRWSDGTRAPHVVDLSASQVHDFQRRTDSCGEPHIEVLLTACHRDRDKLGWVLDGCATRRYTQDASGDHTGPLMRVDGEMEPTHIKPGEDPLLGNEPIINRRAIPRVALVPVKEWDEWARRHPYGATWLEEDAAGIFAKARSLGWKE